MPPAPKPPPEPGTQFGRWTVIGGLQHRTYGAGKKHPFTQVRCACGKTSWVAVSRLVNGYTKSCGCAVKERHTAFMKWRAQLPKSFEE